MRIHTHIKGVRKFSKKVRSKLGLTSHNRLGRALKHLRNAFHGNNSAQQVAMKDSYNATSPVYIHQPRTLSQMTGGV